MAKMKISEIDRTYVQNFSFDLRGDTLEFLSSLHKKARNSDKPVLKLARSEGINRCIIHWLPWKRGFPCCNGVFSKASEDLGT